MTFRSVIRFQVKPGKEAAFEAAFDQCGMLRRPKKIAGFIDAELVRSIGEPIEYFVLGAWQSEQSYADWQAVARPEADPAAIAALDDTLVERKPGRLYASVLRSD